MQLQFFGGWAACGMNLFMNDGMALPMEMPRILLAPCSEGSTTFFSFSSENARLDSKRSFFSFSLSTFIAPQNFFITSPSKSVAPSGGFSFSTTGFFLVSFFLSFLDQSEGSSTFEVLYSLLVQILTEEVSFDEVFGRALLGQEFEVALLFILEFELELLGFVFGCFSYVWCGGTEGALLGQFFFQNPVCLVSPIKLLLLSLVFVLACQKQLLTLTSLLTAPTSPDTICCTKLSNTACESGFLIQMRNDWARCDLFMPTFLFISLRKTLRVCLNLKLSRNYWIKSMQSEAVSTYKYSMDIF